MTTTVLKAMTIPAATLVVAIALGGLFAPAAVRAGEYCSEDGYDSTRNCSFSSMEQCKGAISGTYAACLRDPFLKDDSVETIDRNSDTYLLCRPIASGSAGRQGRQVESNAFWCSLKDSDEQATLRPYPEKLPASAQSPQRVRRGAADLVEL